MLLTFQLHCMRCFSISVTQLWCSTCYRAHYFNSQYGMNVLVSHQELNLCRSCGWTLPLDVTQREHNACSRAAFINFTGSNRSGWWQCRMPDGCRVARLLVCNVSLSFQVSHKPWTTLTLHLHLQSLVRYSRNNTSWKLMYNDMECYLCSCCCFPTW